MIHIKKILIGIASGVLMLGALAVPAFAKDDGAVHAPFYTANSCTSDQVTSTLAGGRVTFVNPDGKNDLTIHGHVKNLTPNTTYQVWVRDLTGYTGSSINSYTPLGYYDLTSLTTNSKGKGSFHIALKKSQLPANTYNLQVALNYADGSTYGCTQIATQKYTSVTVGK